MLVAPLRPDPRRGEGLLVESDTCASSEPISSPLATGAHVLRRHTERSAKTSGEETIMRPRFLSILLTALALPALACEPAEDDAGGTHAGVELPTDDDDGPPPEPPPPLG